MKGQNIDDVEDGVELNLLSNNGEPGISIQDDHQTTDTAQMSVHECSPKCPKCKPYAVFSNGEERRVDYVLAFELDSNESSTGTSTSQRYRECFHAQLQEEQGLLLKIVKSKTSKTQFVLIHAPWDVLAKQAELLRIKMPIYINDVLIEDKGCTDGMLQKINTFKIEKKYNVKEPDYFTELFRVDREREFFEVSGSNRTNFFTNTQRSRMVYDLLIRTKYDQKDHIGIGHLLANGTYSAAYPLHEGDYWISNSLRKTCMNEHENVVDNVVVIENDRQLLYDTWARPSRFYKYQPLTLIKKYFGAKIGLYFAWLGYYTQVLFPAAIFGIFSVIYGITSLPADTISNDLCNATGAGSILMCPICDKLCTFWNLIDSCWYAKFTHIFDNISTVLFAVFMSIWATLFLEGWKRYYAEIAWEWDLMDNELEEEMIRPEFQLRVRDKCAYSPFQQKTTRNFVSGVSVVFFLLLVLASVFGAIVYRVIVLYVLHASDDEFTKTNAPILTAISAAIINLASIIILSSLYKRLAWVLTDWESPRTQAEWNSSYTLKVFLFEFVNCYSSLFYIAFIKGRLSGVPGSGDEDREQGRFRIFGYRLESCDPAGCMVELVIELAVIMTGRQFFETFTEIVIPMLLNAYRRYKHHLPCISIRETDLDEADTKDENVTPRWESDYNLNAVDAHFLLGEYLEMVLQFGFVTLFVAAFPLAPLFALLNNIIEIRLDAYKFLVTNQRPMPTRAKNIGIWIKILDGISKMAGLTNACIIAFTSEFVPKMLYFMTEGNGSYENYVNYSLSYYNAIKLDIDKDSKFNNISVCRFRDYRKPPCTLRAEMAELTGVTDCDEQYGYSHQWWHIFAARLVFVLVFEHLVFLVKGFVDYVIPDIPTHIYMKMQLKQRQARSDFKRPRSKSAQIQCPEDDDAKPASERVDGARATNAVSEPDAEVAEAVRR